MAVTFEERFWAKVDRRGDEECWSWTGATGRGYGQIWVDGRNRKAHRIAWELAYETEFPPALDACHTCDNPPCVNPRHIFPGTASDNAKDAVRKGRVDPGNRRYQTHCKRGHEFTEENTRIVADGARECRTCRRLLNAARYNPAARAALTPPENQETPEFDPKKHTWSRGPG